MMMTPEIVNLGVGGAVAVIIVDKVFAFVSRYKNGGQNGNGFTKELAGNIKCMARSLQRMERIQSTSYRVQRMIAKQQGIDVRALPKDPNEL